MFRIIQNLSFTRYIENTLSIDEKICERWTGYVEDWEVTNLDGTPLIITPKLVEDNWGKTFCTGQRLPWYNVTL